MIFLAKVLIHYKKNGWDLPAVPVFWNILTKNNLVIACLYTNTNSLKSERDSQALYFKKRQKH
jgi:hypothetical protein